MTDRAAALARMDPDMAAAFERELAQAAAPLPARDLAEERRRGIEGARWWNEGLPELAAVEDHEAPGPGGPVRVRLFRPDRHVAAPVVLYLHGGGWAQGSVAQNEPAIRTLADSSGWAVAAPTYRLAPEHPYPAGLDDCRAALAWLRAGADDLGLAPRIALAGASAGANLALATCLASRSDAAPPMAALVLFYGVFGADLDTPSYREFGGDTFGLPRARMAQYLDWYDPAGARHRDPLLQPLVADLTGLPPTWLLAAGLDPLRDETLALHERLEAAGVATSLRVEPGAVHGFINRGRMVRAARDSLAEAARFLRELSTPS